MASEVRPAPVEYDYDIPCPPIARKMTERTEVLVGMPVGASFFFEETKQNQMTSALARLRQRFGYRFQCRTMMKFGKKGVRVWRIADDATPEAVGIHKFTPARPEGAEP